MYATTEDMVNNLISHIYPKAKFATNLTHILVSFQDTKNVYKCTVRNKGNTKKRS